MNFNFKYIPAFSIIANDKKVEQILNAYYNLLDSAGGKKIDEQDLDKVSPLFYFVLTGGTEKIVLDLVGKRNQYIKNEPVYLIAHSSDNSLPASLEILAKLKQDGKKGQIFYLESSTDSSGLDKIQSTVKFISVKDKLSKSKIGLIGEPSDWLIASSPKSKIITERWGPMVVTIDLNEVTTNLSRAALATTDNTNLKVKAENILEPSENEIVENENVYRSVKNIVEKHKLDSLSIRCFDLVLDQKTTGCFAISQLNDDGIIAGCEGDLVSTIGMLVANKLTGKLVWMANPSKINLDESTLTLAHCTVPRKMINAYNLRSHFESGLGVGIEGKLPQGRVTLFRIGGKNMERLWTAEGEIVETTKDENLCRTQAKIKLDSSNKLEELLNDPLGNHLLMIYGDHTAELQNYKNFTENLIEE